MHTHERTHPMESDLFEIIFLSKAEGFELTKYITHRTINLKIILTYSTVNPLNLHILRSVLITMPLIALLLVAFQNQ